jgi:hypothetical protein
MLMAPSFYVTGDAACAEHVAQTQCRCLCVTAHGRWLTLSANDGEQLDLGVALHVQLQVRAVRREGGDNDHGAARIQICVPGHGDEGMA